MPGVNVLLFVHVFSFDRIQKISNSLESSSSYFLDLLLVCVAFVLLFSIQNRRKMNQPVETVHVPSVKVQNIHQSLLVVFVQLQLLHQLLQLLVLIQTTVQTQLYKRLQLILLYSEKPSAKFSGCFLQSTKNNSRSLSVRFLVEDLF